MAFVIAEDKPPGDTALLGGVRLVHDANRESGEFKTTLVADVAGHGVGRRLMKVIINYGRRIGVKEIFGEALQSNTPMLVLRRKRGLDLDSEGSSGGP